MEKLLPTDSFNSNLPLPFLIAAPVGEYRANMEWEDKLADGGFFHVAGIDEAGRGPLAGPVVAAAVILDRNAIPDGLNDSKKLSPCCREELYYEILATSEVSVASASNQTIDKINIRQATLACMQRALYALPRKTDWNLVDGRDIPGRLSGTATAIIKGDGRSLSIAAASIVAKVVRDHMMIEASKTINGYGFEQHKGYGTRQHMEAIKAHGPCSLHRQSYSPFCQGNLF